MNKAIINNYFKNKRWVMFTYSNIDILNVTELFKTIKIKIAFKTINTTGNTLKKTLSFMNIIIQV
jgi:hypothetical protein